MAYQTKVPKPRLVLSPFSSEQMLAIGQSLAASMITRIKSGKNANDQPAKPLKGAKGKFVPYARKKLNHGLAPIRDWTYSGRTLRSLKVLSVNENTGRIGFTDARTDRIAHALNQIDRAFGVSPTDRVKLNNAVHSALQGTKMIQVQRAA